MSEVEPFAIQAGQEASVTEQGLEILPDLAHELGLDQLRPNVRRDGASCLDTSMEVDGVWYPFYKNAHLPPAASEVEYTEYQTRTSNNARLYVDLISRGILASGVDNHASVGLNGSANGYDSGALYVHPVLKKSFLSFQNDAVEAVGGYRMSRDSHFATMPEDHLVDPRDVRRAVDMLLEDERYRGFREVADAHFEKLRTSGKAKHSSTGI